MKPRDQIWIGRRPPGAMSPYERANLIRYLRELAARLGKDTLTSREVKADGKVSPTAIHRRFGSFSQALLEAGLSPGRISKRDRARMLDELRDLTRAIGRTPSQTEINRNLGHRADHYVEEFGDIATAVEEALDLSAHEAASTAILEARQAARASHIWKAVAEGWRAVAFAEKAAAEWDGWKEAHARLDNVQSRLERLEAELGSDLWLWHHERPEIQLLLCEIVHNARPHLEQAAKARASVS